METLISLFLQFLKIGLFSIGGGYAVLPLIKEQIVTLNHWLTLEEFTDIITISQMTPGPLAVNASTFVGLRVAGVSGGILATLGCVLCGLILSLFFYRFFDKYKDSPYVASILKGLSAASFGLIAAASVSIILPILFSYSDTSDLEVHVSNTIIFIFSFLFLRFKKRRSPTTVNPD